MKRIIPVAFALIGLLVAHQTFAVSLPSGPALFETSLQSRISASDTSMTLTENELRGGKELSGYNCFLIDEGRSDAEYVCGTISGESVTSLERGIDFLTGTTSTSTLKYIHRTGANVKITDYPLIQRLRNYLAGLDPIPYVIQYDDSIATSSIDSPGDLTNKEYVDHVAFSGAGIIDASGISKGVVELATGAEAAASTVDGSSGPLVLPSSIATATPTATGAFVPVTQNDGTLDDAFIPATVDKDIAFTGTVSVGGFGFGTPGTYMVVSTTTGTTTWAVPEGVSRVTAWVVGPGGGGQGGCDTDFCDGFSVGGSGGGACVVSFDVTAGQTISYFVGTGGAGGTTSNNAGANGTYTQIATTSAATIARATGGGGGVAGTAGGACAVSPASSLAVNGQGGSLGRVGGGAGGLSGLGITRGGNSGANNNSGGNSGSSGENGKVVIFY